MGKNNSMLIVAMVISVLALGFSVFAFTQKQVGLSPSAASPSYTCYNSVGTSQCSSGQYCVNGGCTASKPNSLYPCFNPSRVAIGCTASQVCYNGACVDSVAATSYYTKAEVDAKVNDLNVNASIKVGPDSSVGTFITDKGIIIENYGNKLLLSESLLTFTNGGRQTMLMAGYIMIKSPSGVSWWCAPNDSGIWTCKNTAATR